MQQHNTVLVQSTNFTVWLLFFSTSCSHATSRLVLFCSFYCMLKCIIESLFGVGGNCGVLVSSAVRGTCFSVCSHTQTAFSFHKQSQLVQPQQSSNPWLSLSALHSCHRTTFHHLSFSLWPPSACYSPLLNPTVCCQPNCTSPPRGGEVREALFLFSFPALWGIPCAHIHNESPS